MRFAVVGGGPAGLYFAILAKKAFPGADITVHERNRADDTFGFGVVFSDETLDNFLSHDRPTYEAIESSFAYWDRIDFCFQGEIVRSSGHGFCGCGRQALLLILHQRCRALGVELRFETEVGDLGELAGADLVVAADGVNSHVRETHATHFRPSVEWRRNRFIWLGSTKPMPAFTFDFATDRHGIWVLGAYQYERDLATWIVEAPEETWASAGAELEGLDEAGTLAYMERLWAHRLEGHRLVANKSIWRRFPTIRNERWSFRNIVLLGDALHTAHYSIGSGTKLAMEDAIELCRSLQSTDSVAAALEHFESSRREEVEKTQHAADVSVVWTENPRRYWRMEPLQAAFSMLSRSKQVTYENLRLRDPDFIARVDRWFAAKVGEGQGEREKEGLEVPLENPPAPMFTPFKLRGMTLANRVVVSPMDMYSAIDGTGGRGSRGK